MTKSELIRIGINGAGGRMGRRLVALACEDPALKIVGAVDRPDHHEINMDAGEIAGVGRINVALTDKIEFAANALIDFSNPEAMESVVESCLRYSTPLVLATTGLSDQQNTRVEEAAREIPVVRAPNMSLAVNLTMKLSSMAARALKDYGPGVDVEIIERHHRFKEDAPSGTALLFGSQIASELGQTSHVHGRHGRPGQRPREEIGYHALRTGDNPGEHTIVFGMMGEAIELTVKATSRDSYALGALSAAKFVAKQPPGLYSMYDVLGL